MPAKAGIQNYPGILDSGLCRHAIKGGLKSFCKTINV